MSGAQPKVRQDRLDAKGGKGNPFLCVLQNIDSSNGRAGISSHAANYSIKYLEPHESTRSWIRATPDSGAQALIQYRSDTDQPEMIRYIEFDHAARIESYRNGHEPYRNLQPGAIDIHSRGYAGAFYSERPFSQNRGGAITDWRDQDNLEHGAFAPVHRRIGLHHINNQFSDEEAFGVVSRPSGETGRFYPKTLAQDFAKSWEIRLKPYSAYPNDMFWYRHGNVIDDDGREELASMSGLPLRLKNIWYTSLPPIPFETVFEIDIAGNASYSTPFTALLGVDVLIPTGSFNGTSALGWSTTTGLDTSIFSGKSYSNIALVDLQMRNILATYDITAIGDHKFANPLVNFEQLATGEILLSTGAKGFVWKLNVKPTGALTIEQQDGGISKLEIDANGTLEFTNAISTILATSNGTIELENKSGQIIMFPSGHIDVDGKTQGVFVGSGNLEPFALGLKLKKVLDAMMDIYAKTIVPTPSGNSGVPIQADLMLALKADTTAMLSIFNKVS